MKIILSFSYICEVLAYILWQAWEKITPGVFSLSKGQDKVVLTCKKIKQMPCNPDFPNLLLVIETFVFSKLSVTLPINISPRGFQKSGFYLYLAAIVHSRINF